MRNTGKGAYGSRRDHVSGRAATGIRVNGGGSAQEVVLERSLSIFVRRYPYVYMYKCM